MNLSEFSLIDSWLPHLCYRFATIVLEDAVELENSQVLSLTGHGVMHMCVITATQGAEAGKLQVQAWATE